jgi:NADPH:quinone reductase
VTVKYIFAKQSVLKEADMEYMKAAVLTAFSSAEVFEFQTIPKPVPKATQVLVRVYATSLNPLDYQTRRGDYKDLVRLPAIIGVDVSNLSQSWILQLLKHFLMLGVRI